MHPTRREALTTPTAAAMPALWIDTEDPESRVGAVAAALAARLGTTVVHAPRAVAGDAHALVRCAAVGLQVAEDAAVTTVLSHPGQSLLAVGPHCTADAMLDGPVVVAFDGSSRAASIFPIARGWALRLEVPVVLAHMWTPIDALDHGSEIFGAVRDALASLGPSTRFEPIRTSYPAGGIRELAHELDASLVAMSSLGADARPGAVIGHVAARVVRECSCPVLLQRPIGPFAD
jgi:nucleotide-binding universal stress UspA family protein